MPKPTTSSLQASPYEAGRAPLFVALTRPHLIQIKSLAFEPRGFWLAVGVFVVAVLSRNTEVNIGGGILAFLIAFGAHLLGTHAPYAIEDMQRFLLLPSHGVASASKHARRRYSPYAKYKRWQRDRGLLRSSSRS